MLNERELDIERDYLKTVFNEIQVQKNETEKSLEKYKETLKQQIKYSADAFYTMDSEEISSTKTILENEELEVIKKEENLNRIKLLENSAYFGRIDFKGYTCYIGISSLLDKKEHLYVSDWRAPISSLYYDYELGMAKYSTINGEVSGEITKKRQYKVSRDNLKWAFDSSLTIGDEILKETLSSDASEKMKNIISTIQKEQNKIIRMSEGKNLLIQGEAGSGKSSIALHRAAYLLYKNAGKLSANDIMIISPNKLFSEYISNILPELGEKNIVQTTFNHLASMELQKVKIYNRDESINRAIEDENFANIIKYKNSDKFFNELKSFLSNFSLSNFEPKDIKFNDKIIKKETIKELYTEKYKSKKVSVRLGWIADHIVDELKLPKALYKRVLSVVYDMFSKKSMTEIYAEFLATQKIESNSGTRNIYFEDAPAVLYIKDYILGLNNEQKVKYLLIDEMQDYNLIHYDIFNKVFDCNKLILGDINQNIFEIYKDKDLTKLCQHIGNCDLVKLTKSYRSTCEISEFCQQIKGIKYDCVDRHGKDVEVHNIDNEIEKIAEILKINNHKKIALICKNQKEVEEYYQKLKNIVEISRIDIDLENSSDRIIISSANSKGIEFDVVIIPNVSQQNYSTDLDRNILYVSATRALHELYLTSAYDLIEF